MKYPISELFYSIQGEGVHSGQAAFFIRLAGCNLTCDFCDTDYSMKSELTEEAIYHEALKNPSRTVIITGGEPTMHNLRPLTNVFKKEFQIHLETNGTIQPDGYFDWVAVSPKSEFPLDYMLKRAQEVKFLCGFERWKETIKVLSPRCKGHIWLMPIADGLILNPNTTRWAKEYCLEHPEVKLCIQTQKVGGFR